MKIRKVIQALLLGGMVMMATGCGQSNTNTTNNERSEIEDKFSRLGEAYPTKDLEELMEKFPNKEIQVLHYERKKLNIEKNMFTTKITKLIKVKI